MDTINELNPHYCGNCFKREGKLENITVNLVQDYFRYHLKLLRIENVKNWEITIACPSGKATMTTKAESWRDFTDK